MPSTDISTEDLNAALSILGLDETPDNRAHLAVLREAMEIYEEREAVRGGIWKEAGWVDSAHHIKSKALRIGAPAPAMDQARAVAVLDDALDTVNYAVFYVRNVRAGRVAQI